MLDFQKAISNPIEVKVCLLSQSVWYQLLRESVEINGYYIESGYDEDGKTRCFYINTLHDIQHGILNKVNMGDYLIIGVDNKIYTCDYDTFHKMYEIKENTKC